jgi:hypothetical protein
MAAAFSTRRPGRRPHQQEASSAGRTSTQADATSSPEAVLPPRVRGGGGASAAALAAPAAADAVWLACAAPQRHSSGISGEEQRDTERRQRTRLGVAHQQVLHSSSRCCSALAGRQGSETQQRLPHSSSPRQCATAKYGHVCLCPASQLAAA